MKKSGSRWDTTPDGTGNLADMCGSMDSYYEQQMRDRNSKTLTLRSANRVSIRGIFGKAAGASPLIDPSNFPYLDPTNLATVLNSDNFAKIAEYCSNICEVATKTPRMLNSIVHSETALSAFATPLGNPISDPLKIQVMQAIASLFPHCGQMLEAFIDSGIFFCVPDFLDISQSSENLVFATMDYICATVKISSYARDSLLCTAVHQQLIELASHVEIPPLSERSCSTICALFSHPDMVDVSYMNDCVQPLAELIPNMSKPAIEFVLQTYVEMTNKAPSLAIFALYDAGIFPMTITLLQDPDLVGTTLKLVGNLGVAKPSQIKELLEHGLLQCLISLLGTLYTADVLWILSNYVETAPELFISQFDGNFYAHILEIAEASSFDVKKEAAFFISTIVIFSTTSIQISFIRQEVFDLLVEMLGCGDSKVIQRCVDTLIYFIRLMPQVSNSGEFATFLLESDMREQLSEILQVETNNELRERAQYLQFQLDQLEKSSQH